MIKTTMREVARHALYSARLDQLIARRRIARGHDIGHLALDDRSRVFEYIYKQGIWRNGKVEGALSGVGSEVDATQVLRDRLAGSLVAIGSTSLLDLGCGDFTWMQHITLDLTYIGIDIVDSVIRDNEAQFGSATRRFECLDAVSEPLPEADVVLCREVLFHLSFADGRKLVSNIRRSGARYLIATTDTKTAFNSDIHTGDFRTLNLQRRPYRFPTPAEWIPDGEVSRTRGLGRWALADLP